MPLTQELPEWSVPPGALNKAIALFVSWLLEISGRSRTKRQPRELCSATV